MTVIHVVAPAAEAKLARAAAKLINATWCDGMFMVAVSSTGNLPATGYISSGDIPEKLAQALQNPAGVDIAALKLALAPAQQALLSFLTPATFAGVVGQIQLGLGRTALLIDGQPVLQDGQPVMVDEDVHSFLARIGLKLIRG